MSRRRVKGWQWPVIHSRFELRSTQSTDQASNAIKKYRKDRENEGTSQTTSLGDRFERISRRSCSTAPSTDCPSTLAEYFATQIGFAWSSRRTPDCSRDNALAETNAVRLLRRSLARQRSVRFRWCWRWPSCRRFACRKRSRPLLLERAQYRWWNSNWSSGRSTATRWLAQIDSSVGAAGACLASNEKAVEEPMSTEVHATQAGSWSYWWTGMGLSTKWSCWWSRSNGSSYYCKCAWPDLWWLSRYEWPGVYRCTMITKLWPTEETFEVERRVTIQRPVRFDSVADVNDRGHFSRYSSIGSVSSCVCSPSKHSDAAKPIAHCSDDRDRAHAIRYGWAMSYRMDSGHQYCSDHCVETGAFVDEHSVIDHVSFCNLHLSTLNSRHQACRWPRDAYLTRSRRACRQRFLISMSAVYFRRFNSLAFPLFFFSLNELIAHALIFLQSYQALRGCRGWDQCFLCLWHHRNSSNSNCRFAARPKRKNTAFCSYELLEALLTKDRSFVFTFSTLSFHGKVNRSIDRTDATTTADWSTGKHSWRSSTCTRWYLQRSVVCKISPTMTFPKGGDLYGSQISYLCVEFKTISRSDLST